jgi:hypothetical protein
MTTVKMIKRNVPLSDDKGEVCTPEIGAVVDVPTDIADALVRGGDAEYCAGDVELYSPKSRNRVTIRENGDIEVAAAKTEQVKAPEKRRTRRSKKNAGAAPENKDAGPSPEDK